MTSPVEVDIKEIILLTTQEYSFFKDNMKYDECGWFDVIYEIFYVTLSTLVNIFSSKSLFYISSKLPFP
jgi:hypothetical protein